MTSVVALLSLGKGQAEVAGTDTGTCLARRALCYRW